MSTLAAKAKQRLFARPKSEPVMEQDLSASRGSTEQPEGQSFGSRAASLKNMLVNPFSSSRDTQSSDSAQNSGSIDNSIDAAKRRLTKTHSAPTPPPGFFSHTRSRKAQTPIVEGETLRGLAARFDTTPSVIKNVNRMTMDFIFPGKEVFVPDKDYVPSEPVIDVQPRADEAVSKIHMPALPHYPGSIIRLESSCHSLVDLDNEPQPPTTDEVEFLDQECFERFIKITSKYITNTHECVDGTLLITPNAVMFDPDLNHPLVEANGADEYGLIAQMDTVASLDIYRKIGEGQSDSASFKELPVPKDKESDELNKTQDVVNSNVPSNTGLLVDLDDSVTTNNDPAPDDTSSPPTDFTASHTPSSDSLLLNPTSLLESEILSHPSSNHNDLSSKQEVKSSLYTTTPNELPKRRYPSGKDIPQYLCVHIAPTLSTTGQPSSFNKKRRQEYWFTVPANRVDSLYAFFIQWKPDSQSNLANMISFVPSPDDKASSISSPPSDSTLVMDSEQLNIHRDWEIVSSDEVIRRKSRLDALNLIPLPELATPSQILGDDHIRKLAGCLPARVEGYPWSLLFGSEQHGFSLSAMYRRMANADTPVLLVIETIDKKVFGALSSCAFHTSDLFYGTGESFLYTFFESFSVYRWAGANNFFNKGDTNCLYIGAGQGSYGIWLDGDLYHGRTQHCETYANDPLTGPGSDQDFVIQSIEVWGFYDS